MARNIVTATVACLYVALSATLVSSVGNAHREVLKQSRQTAAVSRSSSTPGETGRKETLPEAVQPSRSEQSGVKSAPQAAPIRIDSLPSPPSPPTAPAERSAPPAPEKPAPAEASRPALTKADTARPANARLKDLDPFFGLPQAKETWDAGNLTAEQEMELGRQLNEMVLLPRFNRRLKTGMRFGAGSPRRQSRSTRPSRARTSVIIPGS